MSRLPLSEQLEEIADAMDRMAYATRALPTFEQLQRWSAVLEEAADWIAAEEWAKASKEEET